METPEPISFAERDRQTLAQIFALRQELKVQERMIDSLLEENVRLIAQMAMWRHMDREQVDQELDKPISVDQICKVLDDAVDALHGR